MEDFKMRFKEEAQKIFVNINVALNNLTDNNGTLENIVSLYRAYHSLKGGGAMFGYEELSRFNMHLEAALYPYHTTKTPIPPELLQILRQAEDLNRKLLEDNTLANPEILNETEKILNIIKTFEQE